MLILLFVGLPVCAIWLARGWWQSRRPRQEERARDAWQHESGTPPGNASANSWRVLNAKADPPAG